MSRPPDRTRRRDGRWRRKRADAGRRRGPYKKTLNNPPADPDKDVKGKIDAGGESPETA